MSSQIRPSANVRVATFGALGFMAVALGCAAVAAFAVGDMMNARYAGAKVTPIVVAVGPISAGTALAAEQLTLHDWPVDSVPPGAYASIDELLAANHGATPAVGILSGEPIVASRLANAKLGTGIASLIRPQMRAVSTRVNDSVGFTGLLYPGATVDVVATMRDPLGRGPSARIAVQNVRVLSVGLDADVATRKVRQQNADKLTGRPEQGGTYVTLEVTPQDAEILVIARNEGTIDLILRSATDEEIIETEGSTPDKFSAFAPDTDEDSQARGAQTESRDRKHAQKTAPRRIKIVARHEEDQPVGGQKPSGRIQTYHAR